MSEKVVLGNKGQISEWRIFNHNVSAREAVGVVEMDTQAILNSINRANFLPPSRNSSPQASKTTSSQLNKPSEPPIIQNEVHPLPHCRRRPCRPRHCLLRPNGCLCLRDQRRWYFPGHLPDRLQLRLHLLGYPLRRIQCLRRQRVQRLVSQLSIFHFRIMTNS